MLTGKPMTMILHWKIININRSIAIINNAIDPAIFMEEIHNINRINQ